MVEEADRRVLQTAAFAEFLRARREALPPDEFGFPTQRRRVPGLRREEVAYLAAVSNSWYTRLEQGKDVHPTSEVVDSLARALRLDVDAHSHLRHLAGLGGEVPAEPQARPLDDLQGLIDLFLPSPAIVVDELYDFLAWNSAFVALFGIDPAELEPRSNLLWATFTHPGVERCVEWASSAAAMIAHFRWNSVRLLDDPGLAELVGSLSAASPAFADHWSRAAVSRFPVQECCIRHPVAGPIHLQRTLELRLHDRPAFVKVKPARAAVDRQRLQALVHA